MKRMFAVGTALVMSAALLSFGACAPEDGQENEGGGGEKPSSTAFRFAGDLQELYGGEKGYPQAVLVAKKSVIESDEAAVGTMISYMEGSAEYLASADAQAVVEALSPFYTEGMTPSLNAKNLTKEVIANCSVEYYPASAEETRTRVDSYLAELIAVDETATKPADDAFYYTGSPEAGEAKGSYTVYAPDGAPALALANAVNEQGEGETFGFRIVDSSTIGAQVTGASPAADFCILPVNAAAKALGTGANYQMLGIVTNGNMFLLTTGENPSVTADDLTVLVGKTVGVVQLPNVPGLTFRAVLDKRGIAWQVLGNDVSPASDKVNLKAMDASSVTPASGCDYYLCPEPAASTKVAATAGK